MQGIFDFCREVNPYLAVAALILLGYRIAPTILLLGKPTAAARIIFAGYILVTALGSWESQRVGNEATYASSAICALHVGTLILFSFWDFGLSKGIDAQQRTRGELRTRKDDTP